MKVTEIHKKTPWMISMKSLKAEISGGDEAFDVHFYKVPVRMEDSIGIGRIIKSKDYYCRAPECLTAGNLFNTKKNHLSDPNTTLLLVGYQAVGSLGRQLRKGQSREYIWRDN